MPVQFKPRKRRVEQLIPPLLIGALGTVGVVALYILVPGFQPIELPLLLIVVAFGAAGYVQGIVRGGMTALILYMATGIAAALYPILAPYVGATQHALALLFTGDLFGAERGTHVDMTVDYNSLALSFILVTVILWIALEATMRASFRDTRLPSLGFLDNVGGLLVYLAIGFLVATLLFNALGYGPSRRAHDQALLRPWFNQALAIHYTTQAFWFPRQPPPIYVYDLHLSYER